MSEETGLRARRKRETRERVLDAAIACFVERGFEATTMDAIAERAVVARATVFNHFPDKQSLVAGYLDRRRAALLALLNREQRADADAARQLGDAFDLLAAENERDPAETRILAQAWWRTGGGAEIAPETAGILATAIASGQQRGEFRAGIDPQLAGRILFDAYIGAVIRWAAADPPPFPLARTLREILTLILDGFRDPGRPA